MSVTLPVTRSNADRTVTEELQFHDLVPQDCHCPCADYWDQNRELRNNGSRNLSAPR
eukprot:CAMPEP_0179450142 /NCGR_PEP_ID=MMETSP0799-20121207/34036_1 /TAXON_ID=46947 /ORGANISM="Geminigera cryophila, Strain CCMP2564" /LENGTH=56 /DNA_ID=CAMNT_0021243785 /DNA_START=607 /DNA_END=777 /DNA_ORIENTATION=-